MQPVTGALGSVVISVPAVTDTMTANAATQTLTNKRVNPRVGTVTSSATPTINTDSYDEFTITALATAITSMTTNLSGTPVEGQSLIIWIKDNGTAQSITWGALFHASTATGAPALPTTTTAGKYQYTKFLYNATSALWNLMAVQDGF